MRSGVVVGAMVVMVVSLFAVNSFAEPDNLDTQHLTKGGGYEGKKPWPCCNKCGICTKSNPPICQCNDVTEWSCHPGCKKCVQSLLTIWPPQFYCEDSLTNFCKKPCDAEPLAEAANLEEDNAVRDTDGNALHSGEQYYVLPVIRGRGGGLKFSQRNNSCPFHVAQEASEVSRGRPVTFSLLSLSHRYVQLSTDVNVAFDDNTITICMMSMVWKLSDAEDVTGRRYVVTGGKKGNPGPSTVNNWFKIVRYGQIEGAYRLVFCPSVCDKCEVVCGDVGVFSDDGGKRWLALSDVPFPVLFVAKSTTEV